MIVDQDETAVAVDAEAKRERFWLIVLAGSIAVGLGLVILAMV
jgi:hypothetical protein